MNFCLDVSGLFYADKSFVKVSEKPEGVHSYGIYEEIDPPKLISVKKKVFDMRKAKVLEVVTESFERIFFEYKDGAFHRREYSDSIGIYEGEAELARQLGLDTWKYQKDKYRL